MLRQTSIDGSGATGGLSASVAYKTGTGWQAARGTRQSKIDRPLVRRSIAGKSIRFRKGKATEAARHRPGNSRNFPYPRGQAGVMLRCSTKPLCVSQGFLCRFNRNNLRNKDTETSEQKSSSAMVSTIAANSASP